jgi:hypothetical protein
MKEIADQYGLERDEAWNKELLPHLGRHPHEYLEFALEGMKWAAREAKGDKAKFLELFEKYVKTPIRENPDMLRKKWWSQ